MACKYALQIKAPSLLILTTWVTPFSRQDYCQVLACLSWRLPVVKGDSRVQLPRCPNKLHCPPWLVPIPFIHFPLVFLSLTVLKQDVPRIPPLFEVTRPTFDLPNSSSFLRSYFLEVDVGCIIKHSLFYLNVFSNPSWIEAATSWCLLSLALQATIISTNPVNKLHNSHREYNSHSISMLFSSPKGFVAQAALLGGLLVQSVDAQYYKIGTKGTR